MTHAEDPKHLTFWFDPGAPLAHLAFERLPQQLEGVSYSVAYRPVHLSRVLAHAAQATQTTQTTQTNPAEIEAQRVWSLRHAHAFAQQHGIDFAAPAQHPFDSTALVQLLLACVSPALGTPNRFVCETVLRHVWRGGADANDAQRLAALTLALAPRSDPAEARVNRVQQALQEATAQALALGIVDVPTIEVDTHLFCGLDALPRLSAYLRGGAGFDSGGGGAAGAAGPVWDAPPGLDSAGARPD